MPTVSILKGVKSHERLLDEVTHFHRVETNLPESQKRTLRMLHDKETVFHGKTVLLVDDDVRNIFALSSVLEDRGFLFSRRKRKGSTSHVNIAS